jgi:hypothetical protein
MVMAAAVPAPVVTAVPTPVAMATFIVAMRCIGTVIGAGRVIPIIDDWRRRVIDDGRSVAHYRRCRVITRRAYVDAEADTTTAMGPSATGASGCEH